MFVKSNKNVKGDKVWYTHHIVRSRRVEGKKNPTHEYVSNITALPDETVEKIRALLRGDLMEKGEDIDITQGDALRGAGQMAIARAWKKSGLEKSLRPFTTEAQRKSIFAMIAARLTDPSSKLALKNLCRNTFWAQGFSDNRLDEDVLYEVMDVVAENFEGMQKRLAARSKEAPTLLLYDITSSYFEGTKAEGAAYGHSRDKRWDRYQIVIALVCDQDGCPLAVEVWPGNTTDCDTVKERLRYLRNSYGIKDAIFVGDQGMYSKGNLEYLEEKRMDYILGLEWHRKKKLLLSLSEGQQELFTREGVYEWEEDGVRYVGCHSEEREYRDRMRRESAMDKVEEKLSHLRRTASQGRYYTLQRLKEKIGEILKWHKVSELWNISIEPLEEGAESEEKLLLELSFSRNELEIERRRAMEGRYVIATTVSGKRMSSKQVIESYKSLQKVERGFRHIKSFLKIRPIYHRLWRRIRAHVLICFFAYYLTWWMAQEFKSRGITTQVESLLQLWDQLQLAQTTVNTPQGDVSQWNWTLGEIGSEIKSEIKEAGLWRSIDAYRRSASKKLK